jgi:hypothetical protein
MVETSSSE